MTFGRLLPVDTENYVSLLRKRILLPISSGSSTFLKVPMINNSADSVVKSVRRVKNGEKRNSKLGTADKLESSRNQTPAPVNLHKKQTSHVPTETHLPSLTYPNTFGINKPYSVLR